MFKTSRFALIVGFAISVSTPALAQETGDTFVRAAVARTKLVDKGDVYTNGVLDPAAGYKTRDTFQQIITVGRFITDNFAIEGSLSTPGTTNNIPAGSLAGTPNLGDDEFILGTLGASFHPVKGRFSPYFGGGVQFHVTTQQRDGLAVGLNIPSTVGPYAQAGVEYKVNGRWGIFAEARKAWYHTNATGLLPLDATYTRFAKVDARAVLDPLTIQLGLTAHFGKDSDEDTPSYLDDGKKWSFKLGYSTLRLRDEAQMVVAGTPLVGEGISTNEHQTLSAQVGYYFNDNFAINATVGFPPKINVYAAGTIGALPKLGEVRYGPTALTLQYHPINSGRLRPYIGAGMSYMIVFSNKDGAFQNLKVGNDLAPAFEIGTDVMLGRNWGMFMDIKKAFLRPRVTGTFGGNAVDATTKLDPLVISSGIVFRM